MFYFRRLTLFLSLFFAVGLTLSGCDTRNRNIGSPELAAGDFGRDGSYSGSEGDYYPGEEQFGDLVYNNFVNTNEDNLSTFGIDVDTGSYTFGRKKINEGQLPPPASVRVEEYINYFRQDYPPPDDNPFAVYVDGARSPFRGDEFHLLRIGLQARNVIDNTKPWNLTFLIDISGSMTSRLDLVKQSLYILIDEMREGDLISVCTYAGGVRTILPPTSLSDADRESIKGMIGDLQAGGSTAMASGLQNAYQINREGFLPDGVNRILVCSDGDANVGPTSHDEMFELIRSYVEEGITLSTLGFGQGNYNDYGMEQLADMGNGNYYYIDSLTEAARLFTEELVGVMEVIAKDVKVQVEFNPEAVRRYRLIGYENRAIHDDDFKDETTDAGEIGAGHRVTALYEIELVDGVSGDVGTVHLRYKQPSGHTDIPLDVVIPRHAVTAEFDQASRRFQFTAGVAEFAEILRESPYVNTRFADVEAIVENAVSGGDDRDVEFLELVRRAMRID